MDDIKTIIQSLEEVLFGLDSKIEPLYTAIMILKKSHYEIKTESVDYTNKNQSIIDFVLDYLSTNEEGVSLKILRAKAKAKFGDTLVHHRLNYCVKQLYDQDKVIRIYKSGSKNTSAYKINKPIP